MTLVTTLIDAELYPADALAELYGTRWRVEEHLKALKQTMKMDVLKCKTVEGVLKELTMYAVAYNLVRVTMCTAAGRQNVVPDRVSFIDALRWLQGAEAGEAMPELVTVQESRGFFTGAAKVTGVTVELGENRYNLALDGGRLQFVRANQLPCLRMLDDVEKCEMRFIFLRQSHCISCRSPKALSEVRGENNLLELGLSRRFRR